MSWIETSAIERPYLEFIRSEPFKAKRIRSFINSGRRLLAAGRTDEARHHFLQALNVFPHVTPALNNLAMIALSDGDIDRALEVIHESLRSDPKDPVAHSIAAQCWQAYESDPFLRAHANAALEHYLQLIQETEPVEPEYPETALAFVLQVLILAEDDNGLVRLYAALITRDWDPLELTWFGIAHFNSGDISEAYRLWRRASKSKCPPALSYVQLAQHVLHQQAVPFRLDYEFILPDELEVLPFASFSLLMTYAINGVYGENTPLMKQSLLAYLVEQEVPGMRHLLRAVFHNETLPLGLRFLAGANLIWQGEEPSEIVALHESFDESKFLSQDADIADIGIAYHLLGAVLLQLEDDPFSVQLAWHEVQIGLSLAEQVEEVWATELFHEMLADLEHREDKENDLAELDGNDDIDDDDGGEFI